MRIRILLSTLVLAVATVSSQETIFRTTTRLIQVNVIVLDKKGKPVLDLKKEDFTLLDKGKPQTISAFSVEQKRIGKPMPKLQPGFYTNLTNSGGSTPNLTVILIDSLNTQWGDQSVARQHIIKFLEQIKPEDRVALMILGRQLRVLHSFTDDRESLLKAVKKWHGREEVGGIGGDAETVDLGLNDIFGGGGNEMEQDMRQSRRIIDSLAAMESVGNYLAGSPGRKNLIWVSGGFPLTVGFDQLKSPQVFTSASQRGAPSIRPPQPKMGPGPIRDQRTFTDEVDKTMKVLNNANIAVYPVDARGLTIDTNAHETIGTMQEFASRTGGRAFYNRNDIDTAIRQVMEETEVTYTLAFYPTGDKSDGQFHDLKVKVNRPGMSVRNRKGWVASKPEDNERSRERQLAYAAHSPLEATALGIVAKVTKKDDSNLLVQLVVDPNGVNLEVEKDKDGKDRYKGRVDILWLQRDKSGADFASTQDVVDLNLLKETYDKMRRGGLIYNKQIALSPKAEFIRIVVRDATSTLSGSVTAKWDIPEATPGKKRP